MHPLKHLSEIEKKISYKFKNTALLVQAFTRTSFCNEHNYGKLRYSSNEVLEFFGDGVLSAAIISIFLDEKTESYEHGIKTELGEGDFSNLRSKLSDKTNLSHSMAALGLQKYLLLGEGDAKLGIANEPSVMEDLFESIVGAVYIDCGKDMKTVIKTVKAMLDTSVYFDSAPAALQSHKNALQEFCADKKRRLPAPVYKTLSETGPDHRKVYERVCYIGDKAYGVGKGKNQKLADTAAAEATLAMLKKEESALPPHDSEAPKVLKNLAASKKLASPLWRDLGESEDSSEAKPEYKVECSCMGYTECGAGASKQEARARAAEKILKLIEQKAKAEAQAHKKTGASAKKAASEKPKEAKLSVSSEKLPSKKAISSIASKKANAKAPEPKKANADPSPKKRPHWHKKQS